MRISLRSFKDINWQGLRPTVAEYFVLGAMALIVGDEFSGGTARRYITGENRSSTLSPSPLQENEMTQEPVLTINETNLIQEPIETESEEIVP